METWLHYIVQKLKDEKMFASQGGPIIMAQVTGFPRQQNSCLVI